MEELQQSGRFLQLKTPLGENTLLPLNFYGEESISQPFQFNIQMISADININAKQLLHKTITLKIVGENIAPRYINGLVHHFQAGEISHGMRYYQAEIKPWFWFLNYAQNCRIYQNQSVLEIAKKIFKEFSFNNFDTHQLSKSYKKRDYCTQYRESAFHFINRLFQEEGIFYFFKHDENKHTLILGDSTAIFKNRITDLRLNKDSGITHWQRHYQFYSGSLIYNDFHFESSNVSLITRQSKQTKLLPAAQYEHYDYPGNYQTIEQGKKIAQQNFTRLESQYELIYGETNNYQFECGKKFNISDSAAIGDEGDYVLISIIHSAQEGSYLHGSNSNQYYANLFTCIPVGNSYLPPLRFHKPLVSGTQTAIVVGAAGEELYTDKYGRVKVQFHWDRQSKNDEYSSCWIRVSQNLAGKQWGSHFIPRVGQEVIVQFINGDPDQPVIIGSVYNDLHLPPYNLPFDQTQSGIKTCSTHNDGSAGNELRFEDKNGQEEIYIYAQKDFRQMINNNLTIQANGCVVVEAKQSIELKVGGNWILINSDGISMNGSKVNIN